MTVFSTMLVSSYSYEAINRSSNHHLCVFKISYLILGCGGSTEMEIKSYHFQKLEDVRNELTITHVNKKNNKSETWNFYLCVVEIYTNSQSNCR